MPLSRKSNSTKTHRESLREFLSRRPLSRDLAQVLAALLLLCLPLSSQEIARNANGDLRKSWLDALDSSAPLRFLSVEPCRPQAPRAIGRGDGNDGGNGWGTLLRSRVRTGANGTLALSAALLLLAACTPRPDKGRTRYPTCLCILRQRLARKTLPVRAGP